MLNLESLHSNCCNISSTVLVIFKIMKFFQIEEDCRKLNFDYLSIFRPGLLGRGGDARLVEKLYGR